MIHILELPKEIIRLIKSFVNDKHPGVKIIEQSYRPSNNKKFDGDGFYDLPVDRIPSRKYQTDPQKMKYSIHIFNMRVIKFKHYKLNFDGTYSSIIYEHHCNIYHQDNQHEYEWLYNYYNNWHEILKTL